MTTEKHPPPSAANDEQNALATLKSLLLGAEQSTIERLQEEANSPEVQGRRVAETLPGAVARAYRESPRAFTRALEAPVAECLEATVRRNPTSFADILYPVMGPAIRRSISQALKGLVQQINQTLEHSLTLKGLKWRLEAARSGIPFAEVVLQHTLRYRVEQAFLIQNGSGLLIQQVSQGPARGQDADAVSAMLTAIRDFAHDTLDRDGEDSKLETIDVGEHTLWLVHGPKAYLACAIRGVPPVGLRDELQTVIEEVHRQQGRLLEQFDGDPAQAATLTPLIEPCLRSEMAEPAARGFAWPLLLILLTLAAGFGWWGYQQWQAHRHAVERDALHTAARAVLDDAPGIVLTGWHTDAGRLVLRGLHDPLTPAPDALLAGTGLSAADYRLEFRAFQSSDAGAALARARQRLAPPDTVSLSVDQHGTLTADGFAPTHWVERASLLATTVPGIERFDDSRLDKSDLRLQRQLLEIIQPPPGVEVTVRDGVADISGSAPLVWIQSLAALQPSLAGLERASLDRLAPLEAERLASLVTLIEESTIGFDSGIGLGSDQSAKLDALAALVAEADQYARQLAQAMQLQIIGRTDGTGTPEQNRFIAHERARHVAQLLTGSGRGMPTFSLVAVTRAPDSAEPDADLRRVEFRVQGLDHAATGPAGN